ncbi:phenazine antibiotic biosynthesis protein [Kitasatospora indigofera]|uniref:Phenazine antibiotic biosynthesis protein n=1 Tax=Kitasatospora indigofera TaxID=67307 RepID=A0A919KPN7_9ACTN|nr:phenazine biosynthesis protein [Kitasatospora indigofera]GHH67136.1 phenazine antibiotic biosynthesis protein [Kitasatospora indigofera]
MSSDDFDSHLRKLMAWHFGDATGSPFWLGKRATLGFDPVSDVQGAADLLRFPDISSELRSVPAGQLIPQGLADRPFRVYDSGGTTGAPKRIVDSGYRSRLLEWAHGRLVARGVPATGNWLHLGPSGPHVIGFDVSRYAALGNGIFYTVDLDPRWVKRLIGSGRPEQAEEYVQHLLDQAETILRSQDVAVLSTTPPLLEAICAREELYELVLAKVRAIIWAGTSISAESLRLVEEVFFPGTAVAGIYGNSLMGVAPQRERLDGDEYPCVFEAFPETTLLELVDESGEQVGYGERGRVRLHLVAEEMFLPNILERDSAVRIAPTTPGGPDGLADVQTFATIDDVAVIEGVY